MLPWYAKPACAKPVYGKPAYTMGGLKTGIVGAVDGIGFYILQSVRRQAQLEVGVLAVQGDFAEHIAALKRLGVKGREVRLPHHLEDIDGLIVPGGESTTLSRLMSLYDLRKPVE